MLPFKERMNEYYGISKKKVPHDINELGVLYDFMRANSGRDNFKQSGYLEIGSRNGFSFLLFATLFWDSLAVDLPGSMWGEASSEAELRAVVRYIQAEYNLNSDALFADSQKQETVALVRNKIQSYDVCFIDGDHRYAGVKKDWENYGQHAKRLCIFHDVMHDIHPLSRERMGVKKLFGEIKRPKVTIWAGGNSPGYGIVFGERFSK